ncbi:MAG TPA: hypothetical protein VFM01_15430 [Nakamurella sp.]|nr:hypothetical protein [Nakamurella sp.]
MRHALRRLLVTMLAALLGWTLIPATGAAAQTVELPMAAGALAGAATGLDGAAVVRDGGGTYRLLGDRGDGRIYRSVYASQWSVPQAVTGSVRGLPATALFPGGRMAQLVVGTDGHLYQRGFSAGKWHGWRGTGLTGAIDAGVALATLPDGSLFAFFLRADHRLYRSLYRGGRWTAPARVSGVVAGAPAVAQVPGSNRFVLAVVGSEGVLYAEPHLDGRRLGWRSTGLRGLGNARTVHAGSVAAAVEGPYTHIFVVDPHRAVRQAILSGGRWRVGASLGGVVRTVSAVGQAALGRVDVFAVGTDGLLYQRVGLKGGFPSGWHRASDGQVSTAPAPGTARTLASTLLDRWGSSLSGSTMVLSDLRATAAGKSVRTSCGTSVMIDKRLLSVLLAATDRYRIGIYDIVTGHSCDSGQHPKGRAADISSIVDPRTGASSNLHGNNPSLDHAFAQFLADRLAPVGGLGQRNCAGRSGLSLAPQVLLFDDGCTHQHVDVRPTPNG